MTHQPQITNPTLWQRFSGNKKLQKCDTDYYNLFPKIKRTDYALYHTPEDMLSMGYVHKII
jgi:hypothetical protein